MLASSDILFFSIIGFILLYAIWATAEIIYTKNLRHLEYLQHMTSIDTLIKVRNQSWAYQQTLRFYASPTNWAPQLDPPVYRASEIAVDEGIRARKVLEKDFENIL